MPAKYRITDIYDLKCNLFQDLLRLKIIDDWKDPLYLLVRERYNDYSTRIHYKDAKIKIEDLGLDNYDISDMDVTFISTIFLFCRNIAHLENNTKRAFEIVRDDRNFTNHRTGNEPDELLYQHAWESLNHMEDLIRVVFDEETEVAEEKRSSFRQSWIRKIRKTKKELFEELIELLQEEEKYEEEIQKIIDSDDPELMYFNIRDFYFKKDRMDEKYKNAPGEAYRFAARASDAGIRYAHRDAAFYYAFIDKPDDAIRHLQKLYKEGIDDVILNSDSIVSIINMIIERDHAMTTEMAKLLDVIKDNGEDIYRHNGKFIIRREYKNTEANDLPKELHIRIITNK